MLFRCSVCKGQFEVEADRKKAVVFCSHCGAALRTGKPGERGPSAPSPALAALGGDPQESVPADAPSLDDLAGAQRAPAGYLEEYESTLTAAAQPSPSAYPPAAAFAAPQPAASPAGDPLAALGGGGTVPASAPVSYRRRPIKRKSDSGPLLVILAIGGLFVVVVVVFAVIYVASQKEPPRRVIMEGGGGPDLFQGVKYQGGGGKETPKAPPSDD